LNPQSLELTASTKKLCASSFEGLSCEQQAMSR
jgi:hypothetical protein